MIEPRRLRDQGATGAERALLNSARADGPPRGASQRLMVALEGLTAGRGSTGSPAAAHSIKLGAVAKVGLVAMVGLGALRAGALVHRIAGQRSVSGDTAVVSTPVVRERPGSSTAKIAREIPAPETVSEASELLHASETAPLYRPTSAKDESLSAEIRILDLARAALEARTPAAAQRALDTYAQRFPQGRLKPEATVLRLAVLVRQGNRAAAKSLAAELLASESYRAYAYRIRSLLRETGE